MKQKLQPWDGVEAHVPEFDVPIGTARRRSAFMPRCCTYFNCRIGRPFLHKWRGLRTRGRAMQLAIKAHKAAEERQFRETLIQAFEFLGWR